jgi:geranylgeranyl diphosphate synthase type 3
MSWTSDYIPLVNLIGVFFQIRDDLMNLQSNEVSPFHLLFVHFLFVDIQYTSKKGFAEDLTEGKFSFPVVHGIHTDTSNKQILSVFILRPPWLCSYVSDVLQKRPKTPTLKIHTIDYLRDSTKSFEYTNSVLDKLESQIRNEISRLGGNQHLDRIMDVLRVPN